MNKIFSFYEKNSKKEEKRPMLKLEICAEFADCINKTCDELSVRHEKYVSNCNAVVIGTDYGRFFIRLRFLVQIIQK